MDGAGDAVRRRGPGRRLLTRILPGGVMVMAALALPEFSVGAGDLGGGEGLSDPPEPAARRGQAGVNRGSETAKPGLAGVRYAPILDLGTDPVRAVTDPVRAVAAVPLAVLAEPSLSAASRPLPEVAPAVPVPQSRAVPPGLAEAAVQAPPLPAEPVAAVAAPVTPSVATQSAWLPESAQEASLPEPAADNSAFAILLPDEQPALRAPAGTLAEPVPEAAPASVPVPEAAARVVSVAAPVVPVQPAMLGAIEQVGPARIAASAAPAARPVQTAPAPQIAPAPIVAKAPVAAPAARAPVSAAPSPPAAVVVPKPAPALAAPVSASPSPIADLASKSQLVTRVDGRTAGALDFQQTAAGLKVRLGSVVEVLADRYDDAQLARIRTSAAGNAYVSLAELQAQGIPISYDPVYDEFNIGRTDTRPKAARKVHMDQISAPERGLGATGMAQVPRPR